MLNHETIETLKFKAAHWVQQFDIGLVLDSNNTQHSFDLGAYELIIGAGVRHKIVAGDNAFERLKQFKSDHPNQWILGYLNYDLKNQLEQLSSNHPDSIGFDDLFFFVPEQLLVIDKKGNILEGEPLIKEILSFHPKPNSLMNIELTQRVSKENYLKDIASIQQHIVDGDVYELNYCTEFYANHITIDPATIYNQLKQKSPVPFGCFLKQDNRYVMGASPERFLKKVGNKLYSQPIKGTAPRAANVQEDEAEKWALQNSEKERAENLMIVDLVRNDLARTAQTGSVKVEELFGIYTFPQVHQMISTVSSTIRSGVNPIDCIQYAFPMGSMTGAPKIMAMQLIELYEKSKRGLYSGAIGYFNPAGDFDLNVVIRSIQYNSEQAILNFEVGSAITYNSVPELEYEECLLKAKAMMQVLNANHQG